MYVEVKINEDVVAKARVRNVAGPADDPCDYRGDVWTGAYDGRGEDQRVIQIHAHDRRQVIWALVEKVARCARGEAADAAPAPDAPAITAEEIEELEAAMHQRGSAFIDFIMGQHRPGSSRPWMRLSERVRVLAVRCAPALLAEARSAATLRDQLAAREAEIAELREALEPLCRHAAYFVPFYENKPDDMGLGSKSVGLNLGHLRRAAALTKRKEGGDGTVV